MSNGVRCHCHSCTIRGLMWPAVLITLGVLFLLDRAHFGPFTTRVTVQFFDLGDQTEVLLVQDGFPNEESLKTISKGTHESFAALDAIFTNRFAKQPEVIA